MNQSRTEIAQSEELEKRKKILELIPSISFDHNRPRIVNEDSSAKVTDETHIVSSRNLQFQGFLKIFHALIEKLQKITETAKDSFWIPIILYNENAPSHSYSPTERLQRLSNIIPLVNDLYDFVSECLCIFRNFMIQMALYKEIEDFPNRKLIESHKLWRTVGDLLSQLIILDEIVINRPQIREDLRHLVKYFSSVKAYRQIASSTEEVISEEQLHEMEGVYKEYGRLLFSGNAFREACEQTLGDIDTNQGFAMDMHDAVVLMFQKWEKIADEDQPDRRGLLAICALTSFYHNHFANFARPKLVQTVFTSHKKIISFVLIADITFNPSSFLIREVSNEKLFDRKMVANIEKIQKERMSRIHIENVINEAHSHFLETSGWVGDVNEKLKERKMQNSSGNIAKISIHLSELFLKGIRIADEMTRLLKSLIKYLKTTTVGNTFKLAAKDGYRIFDIVEAIKMIAFLINTNWFWFSESLMVGEQQWRYNLIQQIEIAKSLLREKKSKYPENELVMREDAFRIARNVLLSTANSSRTAIASLSLEFAINDSLISDQTKKQLFSLLRRIENVCEPRKLLARVTDCSFLTLMESFIEMYWSHVLTRKPSEEQILMFSAIATDCVSIWKKSKHDSEKRIGEVYYEIFRKEFLSEICRKIENDLRILAHPHLEIDKDHHLTAEDSKYLQNLINMKSFKIYDRVYNIKEFVSRHLEKSFYNLTVVVPNDGQTYIKMAEIGNKKYGLQLINGRLHQGGIDESCDIMEMTINMSNFVNNYDFSLSEQMFIEKQSPNRSLRVISRDDLMKAFRRYGSGLLPTVLNMTYQILRVKLNIFYKFMSDDHIKARLQFEIKKFEADKSNEKKYSMKNAVIFANKIASIGGKVLPTNEKSGNSSIYSGYYDDEKPKSYLDKFRELITQIGNALSYAKLMTSASNSLNSESGKFLTSDIQEMVDEIRIMDFENDDESRNPIQRILNIFSCREKESSSEFNKLLVSVFRNSLKNDFSGNAANDGNTGNTLNVEDVKRDDLNHLRNFYTIVPALTISQVEQMYTCRTRVRNNLINDCAKELTIANDGFSVGVAYILTILGVWSQLDSLRWFDAAIQYTEEEKKNAIESLTNSKGASLKLTRMQLLSEEYDHLFKTLKSARIFFEFLDTEDGDDIGDTFQSF